MKQVLVFLYGLASVAAFAQDPAVTVESLYELVGDVVIREARVPDSENGYLVAESAVERMQAYYSQDRRAYVDSDEDLAQGKIGFEEALREVERALAMPVWQGKVPEYKTLGDIDPVFAKFKVFATVSRDIGVERVQSGKAEEGVRILTVALRLGKRMRESSLTLMQNLEGLAVESIGRRGVQMCLSGGRLGEAEIDRLLASDVFEQGLDLTYSRVLRGELTYAVLPFLATVTKWELVGPDDDAPKEAVELARKFEKLGFDREATAQLLAGWTRRLIEQLDGYDRSMPVTAEIQRVWDASLEPLSSISDTVDDDEGMRRVSLAVEEMAKFGNPLLGFFLLRAYSPPKPIFKVAALRGVAERRLLRIALLARKAELGGSEVKGLGDFGLSADELVDPLSGNPFGFDVPRKVVWSVWDDGVDDGGVERVELDDGSIRRDLVFGWGVSL